MEETEKKIEFAFRDGREEGSLTLYIGNMNAAYTEEELQSFLSEEEREEYERKKNDKRKKELFFSRKMAKKAIGAVSGSAGQPNSVSIRKGQFQHPLVAGKTDGVQVSITHCKNYAAALAFPERLILGLDMESVDHKEQLGIEEILTERERKLIPPLLDRELFALVMWTAKEALGKFLKLGLTVSMEVLQICKIAPQDGGYRAEFRYFPNLQANTYIREEVVYTIVCAQSLQLRERGTGNEGK